MDSESWVHTPTPEPMLAILLVETSKLFSSLVYCGAEHTCSLRVASKWFTTVLL